jgi:hypothetical protein
MLLIANKQNIISNNNFFTIKIFYTKQNYIIDIISDYKKLISLPFYIIKIVEQLFICSVYYSYLNL